MRADELATDAYIDLGECTATTLGIRADRTDDMPCGAEGVVVLYSPVEWDGLVLCEKCYLRHQHGQVREEN